MARDSAAVGAQREECDAPGAVSGPAIEDLRARVRGKNINEKTLLATDYLNHFSEIVMILELVADMPECLEEAQAWSPKSYEIHFEDSAFADKELAILAYRHAPAEYREPFDQTITQINAVIEAGMQELAELTSASDGPSLEQALAPLTADLRSLIDAASAIIQGDAQTNNQSHIDEIMGD